MFKVCKNNSDFSLHFKDRPLLERVCGWVTLDNAIKLPLHLTGFSEAKSSSEAVFENKDENIGLTLNLIHRPDSVLLKVRLVNRSNVKFGMKTFLPDGGLTLVMTPAFFPDGLMANYLFSPWWNRPHFDRDVSRLPARTQSLLMQENEVDYCFLPLMGDDFKTELSGCDSGITLTFSSKCGGYNQMEGFALAISGGHTALSAVNKAFDHSFKNKAITVQKLSERTYPEQFEYLGWCSWDACKRDVNEDLLRNKLQEFKEKDIPVKWMIIDDGWNEEQDEKLLSLYEDRKKFPNGLSAFIRSAKNDYRIQAVGIWHAMLAYWEGIQENTGLYREQKDNLVKTNAGYILPSFEYEKAFAFYNGWHTYLQSQGVDFIKADVQSSLAHFAKSNGNISKTARAMHQALDQSVMLHFNGRLINCMGMAQENMLSRPLSPVVRSSDDFYPERAGGFSEHVLQNAYNSVYQNHLYYCDFDMWWTNHDCAKRNAVLRAISGGPVYISDRVGETQKDLLLPLVDEQGKIYRCDHAAYPTQDCMYTDCTCNPLKLWNVCGDTGILAVFNMTTESDSGDTVEISADEIEDVASQDYVVYDFFQRQFIYLPEAESISVTVEKDEVALYHFYPIHENCIKLGDLTKYIGCARPEQLVSLNALNLQNRNESVLLKEYV